MAGDRGRSSNFIYGSAYAGLIAFLEGLAAYGFRQGIFVQIIKPGFVDTPMTAKIHEARASVLGITPQESLARMAARIPLGRVETPEDVAGAVSFLCSPDAAYITGQALNVCGGMEMN